MTTERKTEANRINAKASTGPSTKLGKLRAKGNARRHGLNVSIFGDFERSTEIDDLAVRIAGKAAGADLIASARNIASAQIDLMRIRRARHDLLTRELDAPEFLPKNFLKDFDKLFKSLARRIRKFGPDSVVPLEMLEENNRLFHWEPQGAEKFDHVFSKLSSELLKIDRYERRALSRRKFAIRAFDAARLQAGLSPAPPNRRLTPSMPAH